MERIYKEALENHVIDGVIAARATVRSPVLSEFDKLSECYNAVVENFLIYAKDKHFKIAESEYKTFCENGGRRSKFATRVQILHITVTDERQEKLSLLTEVFTLEGTNVVFYHRESAVWDTNSQCILPKNEFKIKQKRGQKHDGFYLKNGKTFLYKVLPVYGNSDENTMKSDGEIRAERTGLKMRDIGKIIEEWQV